ncbi:uncharacterized protein LOC129768708 [Toxorhynchites rutilus septentrionalis]|uniref:uncharacterized protein LOC129768708 n=1 Tax=Toxorhynchites rutilus septentrionalis TaxID=329112 RepID=UPI002479AC79|nr:uncharacterized protein LOC129768708 [Toxorhynchites rutilus septentrionalis]
MPKVNTNEGEVKKWTGVALEGTKAGTAMQTRFKLIPDHHLNKETVAGIRDMNLGRVRPNGVKTGRPTIRFDTGQNTGVNPHINFDPRGHPSYKNPHVEVPGGVVEGAQIVSKTLKYCGIALTVAAIAIDTWRLGSAFKDDLYIRDNANEIIAELEEAIRKLSKQLEASISYKERQEIRRTIEELRKVLTDVKRTRKVPVKSIKTASSIAGGWSAGLAGGAGGAWAGAQAGAAIGTFFGPIGTVVGGPIGAVVGGISAAIAAGAAGSAVGTELAEQGLKLAD